MARYWTHKDSDDNTVVTVQDPTILGNRGLLDWAREVPKMHAPYRNGDRLIFILGKNVQLGPLIDEVARYLGAETPQLVSAPRARAVVTTVADLGRFGSEAIAQRSLIRLASR